MAWSARYSGVGSAEAVHLRPVSLRILMASPMDDFSRGQGRPGHENVTVESSNAPVLGQASNIRSPVDSRPRNLERSLLNVELVQSRRSRGVDLRRRNLPPAESKRWTSRRSKLVVHSIDEFRGRQLKLVSCTKELLQRHALESTFKFADVSATAAHGQSKAFLGQVKLFTSRTNRSTNCLIYLLIAEPVALTGQGANTCAARYRQLHAIACITPIRLIRVGDRCRRQTLMTKALCAVHGAQQRSSQSVVQGKASLDPQQPAHSCSALRDC